MVEEMYSNHIVVKAFNGEDDRSMNSTYERQLYSSAWNHSSSPGMMRPVYAVHSNLGYVAICILGGYLTINGSLTVGEIQAFIQYVRQFTQPITQIAQVSNLLQQTVAASERVFDFLGKEEETPDPASPAIDET
jgi:ATP-binding cassette subfamily B protein